MKPFPGNLIIDEVSIRKKKTLTETLCISKDYIAIVWSPAQPLVASKSANVMKMEKTDKAFVWLGTRRWASLLSNNWND